MLPQRKKKKEGPGSPLWMTTYGDMVTNLLAACLSNEQSSFIDFAVIGFA